MSSRTIKLSYFEEKKSILQVQCKRSAIKFVFGLPKHNSSHFFNLAQESFRKNIKMSART